ncbi:hypothetical protein B0H17DRAFT_441123 [Mycena rosella]|uniref:FAD-binding domain-containing protein n=1 Tax=Mycena rosella TaxID=1033263 RepID=A0AAD7DM89_MYCRO|nr:hypothetical protein B0H17DRAFT_441123 [Mycena rosella]
MNDNDLLIFHEQEPRVQRLLKLASHCLRTIQGLPKIGRLADPSLGVVIIGDAAHSVPIHGTHNSCVPLNWSRLRLLTRCVIKMTISASQVLCDHVQYWSIRQVEDGFALGRVFSHLTSRDQIPFFFLNRYNQVQYKRTSATKASELTGLVTSTFPPGPARDAWNRQFKVMSLVGDGTEVADELIAASWATYLVQFNYDANEAADEWWMNWGKLTREKENEPVEGISRIALRPQQT